MKRWILCALLLVPASLASADTPAQFTAPNLRAPDDPNVNGVRFSVLHGSNQSVRGVDLGLISLSETAKLSGVAMIIGIHKLSGPMDGGAALSLINIHSGKDRGLNASFFNKVNDAGEAVDLGFINVADGATLLDMGFLNVSDRSRAQVGLINATKKIEGLQLGLINIADNGFLPIFPIFNFPKP